MERDTPSGFEVDVQNIQGDRERVVSDIQNVQRPGVQAETLYGYDVRKHPNLVGIASLGHALLSVFGGFRR